jgi:tagatose 6-phosphate kinase
VKAVSFFSGGKAVNVARALKALHGDVKVIGVLAGRTGSFIEEDLRVHGSAQEWILAPGETRTNITLKIKKDDRTVRLLEGGAPLTAAVQSRFKKIFLKELLQTNVVVFSGSLPPSTDTGLYARLIRLAQAKHVMSVLDTSGAALRAGLKASPFIIKPNRQEAEDVLGYSVSSDKALVRGLKELAGHGPRIVLVSLGEKGLAGYDGARMFVASSPERRGNTVGCGDAALAGFISAFLKGDGFDQCVRYAAACGSANVDAKIPGLLDTKKIKSVLLRTRVKQLL